MKTFRDYLLRKGEAFNTVRTRENTAKEWMEWCESEEIKPKEIKYEQLMNYVSFCHQKKNTTHTIRLKIKSLEHYFSYLEIPQNPAKLVQLKGGTKKLPSNILSLEELFEIYTLQTTFGLVEKRNKVLLSLVVFQGVGSSELRIIELKDVDLMNGKIYIPATRTTNSRTLDLQAKQLLLFQDYIINVRSEILKEANKSSAYFLVNHGQGKGVLSNVISALLLKLRMHYPKLKNLQQIRQSVISEWLKKHGLRKTQYMAGHRYVSSTERYDIDSFEGLKKELKSHYLLKK